MTPYDEPTLPGLGERAPAGRPDSGQAPAHKAPGQAPAHEASGPVDVSALDTLDWPALTAELDTEGVALTPPLLTPEQCAEVRALFDEPERFRSTVTMSAHRFGEGRYRYFGHPLPPLVRTLRERLYPPLAQIANTWADRLGEPRFPLEHSELIAACAAEGQHRPTPLLLRYEKGGYNCLHQDVYGALTFPLQLAVLLDRPDVDFTGGESVFVEQRPRAQSRPLVRRPVQGQGMIFAVRNRPVPSARGFSRVALRHGVSAVHDGQRHVLGVIFHDAL
ncbi:2OG-Fe(II) oxygenase [Streptomyces sp. LHD-70]|uniref:2OG-Fe(II) oxygenase n=1 Tax=Streptomyces sp. LHD-70 TaxID=3072140 RepID=UPI00280CA56C|nr:2OG-Fe(II) oxygenase [Streptomyces sp. LHD-70]MDQ8706882.1 2OG-Fe(II) oxygenase [Streptomyces sp. LHD-70]